MEIEEQKGIPTTEWDEKFLQGMVNRMSVSFCKYGAVAEAYPSRVNAVDSLLLRLRAYLGPEAFYASCARAIEAPDRRHRREVGNTEYLMDAANFAMIEFMHPAVEGAHFESTDSDGSTGRITTAGAVSIERNTEDRAHHDRLYKRDGD